MCQAWGVQTKTNQSYSLPLSPMTTEETDCNTEVIQGSVEQRGVCMGQGYRAAGGQMGRHLGGLPEEETS